MELFDQVDKNDDNNIQEEEWLEFWFSVYNSGHSKEEILYEVSKLVKVA